MGCVSDQDPLPILLMADYHADPLWYRTPHGTGGRMISLESLPLSPALKRRLRAWADRYDGLMATGYEWPSPEVGLAWVAEGRDLLEPLRVELGPGYDVLYFHSLRPQRPRSP